MASWFDEEGAALFVHCLCFFIIYVFLTLPGARGSQLFFQLYNVDVVFEDAYGVWREDVGNETPGKPQALFQVNDFLQWLDTAAEDEED